MLEKVLSRHVLRYNDESVYIRASSESAHDQIKPEFGKPTRSIYPKAIAPKCEYLASGFLHNGLREVLHPADMFDEFYSDLLYKLKCRFSRSKVQPVYSLRIQCTCYLRSVSSRPSKLFCLFSSAIRASLAVSSASVGKLCDTGGVTPYFFDCVVAMIAALMLQSRKSGSKSGRRPNANRCRAKGMEEARVAGRALNASICINEIIDVTFG